MIYVEAPKAPPMDDQTRGDYLYLFLAGGITNCPDWQQTARDVLSDQEKLILMNPRRANFPIDDPDAALEQITWEHVNLRLANAVLFWFSVGSINPIVLFEYGKELGHYTHERLGGPAATKLFVGCHPGYERTQDVQIQTALEDADIKVHNSMADLLMEVKGWIKENA